jgi:AcrR family transcriptional regulator
VQDILDRADVGRSTFYAHHHDKEDLVLSGFEDIRSALSAERASVEKTPDRKTEFLQPMLAVFQHGEEYRHTWKPLTRKGGADVVIRILRANATNLLREHFRLQSEGDRDEQQLELAVQFTGSGVMGLIAWWLDNDVAYSAEEIYGIFRKLVTQDLRRFLAVK